MFCSLYLLTFHSASLPTLEMTSGETATFLQAAGVVRSLNSSGSGNCARLFLEGGVAFRPADFGLAYVS